jgi:hypothetical protein
MRGRYNVARPAPASFDAPASAASELQSNEFWYDTHGPMLAGADEVERPLKNRYKAPVVTVHVV